MEEISENLKEASFILIHKNKKNPVADFKGDDWNNKTISFEEANKKLKEGYNIGLVCGLNDFFCIDCDTIELSQAVEGLLPKTYSEQTTSGGYHYFFKINSKMENLPIQDKKTHYGEIRANRQYVVIAPSKAINKQNKQGYYTILRDYHIPRVSVEQVREVIKQFMDTEKTTSSKINSELLEKIQSDTELNSLFEGDIKDYTSRSEAEQSLVNKLVSRNFSKEDVFSVMTACKIGKWLEAPIQYRDMTYNKAVGFVTTAKKGIDNTSKVEFMTFKELKKIKFKKNDYILKGFFKPKEITLIVGASEHFKSYISQYMAFTISRGLDFLGKFKTKKCGVVWADKENTLEMKQERFNRIAKGLNVRGTQNLFLIKEETLGMLDNSEWRNDLIQMMIKNKCKVLFIDTMHRFGSYSENSSDDINEFYLNALNPIRQMTGCSIVLLHHTTKSTGEFRGSSDIMAMLDNMFKIKRDRWGKVWINCKKNRSGEKLQSIALSPQFYGDKFQIKLLTNVKEISEARKTKQEILTEEILKIIPNEPTARQEIKNLFGKKISPTMLTKILKNLEFTNKITKIEKGIYKLK